MYGLGQTKTFEESDTSNFSSFMTSNFSLSVIPNLSGLFGHSQPGGVCNSFIRPSSINLKLGTSVSISKKYSHRTNC